MLISIKYSHWQKVLLLVTEIPTLLYRNAELRNAQFSVAKSVVCILRFKHQCLLSFGSRPEMVTAFGIDDVMKKNGRVAVYLPPYTTCLNLTDLVCGDIKK
jgi:hypothetical protein